MHKNKYLVPALALTLQAGMFTFDTHGVKWFWSEQPIVAGVLLATGCLFWALLLLKSRRSA